MRSFRNIVLSVAAVLVFVLVLNKVSCYLYQSARDNIILMKADLEESRGTVETLLLGTSLMDQGGDAPAISQELDTLCYNLASAAQPLTGSYYLLKDQVKHNPIKRVFLGMSVKSLVSGSDARNTSAKRRVYELMLSPVSKLSYLYAVAEPGEYEQFLLYPARVENLWQISSIKRNIAYKRSEDFRNRVSHRRAAYTYYGMGFQSSEEVYVPAQPEERDSSIYWDRDNLVDENVEYFLKISEFCREKGIELNVVVFPHTEETAMLQGDLADMDAYMEEVCRENGMGLYNYNYTSCEGIYDLLSDECFQDAKHLNRFGAEKFAELLCADYLEQEKGM